MKTNLKEKVTCRLLGIDYMKKLRSEYYAAETKMINELENLEHWGKECKCAPYDNECVLVIDERDDYRTTTEYCMNCGGYVVR